MGPHRNVGTDGAHVRDQIEDYLTGSLSAEQESVFEEHLMVCGACRDEADQQSEVAAALVAYAATHPEPALRPEPVTRPKPASRPQPGTRPQPFARPPAADAADRGPTRPRSAPRAPTRPSRRRLVLSLATAVVLGAVLASGGWAIFAPRSVPNQSVSDNTGVSGQLSITTAPLAGGGVQVRAVVVGLRPGNEFDLVAVGTDGRNYLVAHDTAAGGPQTVVGTIPVPVTQIRFFAAAQAGTGIILVTPAD